MRARLIIALCLVSCEGRVPQGATEDKGGGYQVSELFAHAGCRVYRFSDGGHWRYFVNCGGTGAVGDCSEYYQSCGKNCSRIVHDPAEVPSTFGVSP